MLTLAAAANSALHRMANLPQTDPGNEWRLGEPGEPHKLPPVAPVVEPAHDLSADRLGRVLNVVTVEGLGWLLVFACALVTRLVALGVRPLTAAEARHALFESDLAIGTHNASVVAYHPVWAGWVHLLTAGIFAG